ncbi:MAG: sulfite exporter TauE/SafE family protein [Gemmatimonadota bacterium]
MTVAGAAILLATGAAVGLVSGLAGIGGGVLMVPLLYAYYDVVGADVPSAVAHATSLAVIAPTALHGALRFARYDLVAWRAALAMGGGAAAAALPAALLAARVPDPALRAGFALFLLLTAARMALPYRRRDDATDRAPGATSALVAAGVLVGTLSALLGVGGGVVAIPLLYNVGRLPLRQLAPTSLAVIAPAAATGAITYALSAGGAPALGWSLGMVDVGAAAALVAGSLPLVAAGARLNIRVPEPALRVGLAVLLAGVAARLLWGLPWFS